MSERPVDVVDNPIERLELLAGDDEAIASFLDQIHVTGPREREMLGELARTGTLADPDRFPAAHRRPVGALETLGRHGYHGATAGGLLGPTKGVLRWLIARPPRGSLANGRLLSHAAERPEPEVRDHRHLAHGRSVGRAPGGGRDRVHELALVSPAASRSARAMISRTTADLASA